MNILTRITDVPFYYLNDILLELKYLNFFADKPKMKLSLLLELLVILIIVAYGAAHPVSVSRAVKGSVRQAVAVPAAPVKPAATTDDDDDVDLLALIGDDDGKI